MWQAISQHLSDTLMFSYQITEKTKLSGGDINECYMISDGEQRYFVKVNSREFCRNLKSKQRTFVSCARLILCPFQSWCLLVNQSTMLLSFSIIYLPSSSTTTKQLPIRPATCASSPMGRAKEYGFDQDNYIGSTLQPNKWERKWARFFAEQRIGWQLQLVREKGVNLVDINDFTEVVHEHLAAHQPTPSLLHGDLWHGNTANSVFGPICFDPACYWGDRECDIAMTELFGGFQPEFYQGYESILPLDYRYSERKDIYNLYHLLNHYNQFGGHYLEQSQNSSTAY